MEGTSALADAWYDSHPMGLTCNGKFQNQEFTIWREGANAENPSHPAAWNPLKAGDAFLQFCLFDSTAMDAGPDNPDQGFGYLYEYVRVHKA